LEVHAAIAHRRTRLYQLLSRCFLDVVDTDLLRAIREELEALRYDNPHALETSGLELALSRALETAASVLDCQREFTRLVGAMTPDPLAAEHLGAELQVMSILSMAEANAWQSRCEREGRQVLRREVNFLDAHVLGCLARMYDQVNRITTHPVCVSIARFIGSLCRHDRRMAAEFLDGSAGFFAGGRLRSIERGVRKASTRTWGGAGHLLTPSNVVVPSARAT
jgi:TorA maturation chaperone TorD